MNSPKQNRRGRPCSISFETAKAILAAYRSGANRMGLSSRFKVSSFSVRDIIEGRGRFAELHRADMDAEHRLVESANRLNAALPKLGPVKSVLLAKFAGESLTERLLFLLNKEDDMDETTERETTEAAVRLESDEVLARARAASDYVLATAGK